MGWKSTLYALVSATVLVSANAQAAVSDSSAAFTRYAELEPAVAFWSDVFTKYTQRQIVFHDPYHLNLVYGVADVAAIVDGGQSEARKQKAIRETIDRESKRYGAMVKRVAAGSVKTAEEKRLAERLASIAGLPSAATLAGRIRGQRGLGDEFCGAVERAQAYLPEMRRILAKNGVPEGLANLPLVESSFRISAHSHAGAVGVWQFTRSTGRRFLHIDHVVDERRDPILATEAAAKYLRENYDRLGTWPLAITAYNHGANGMAYAVRKHQTKNLATIIKHYQSRAFGFASRNFYAEFLAAHDAMATAHDQCGAVTNEAASIERVRIGHFVSMQELAKAASSDVDTLMGLNPALQPDVGAGKLYVPKGYWLNLPSGRKARFEAAYAALPSSARFASQPPYYARHRVERGQTLSEIAKLYRTSVAALQSHNDIRDPRSLRAGQSIKIPVAGSAAATVARMSASDGEITHRVARGQTLSHIAKLYRIPVSTLQRYNSISDPRALQSGQTIKIPTGSAAKAAVASSTGGYKTHRVARGQTLSHIARLYRTTVSVLQRHNGIRDPRDLRYGQIIKIPQ